MTGKGRDWIGASNKNEPTCVGDTSFDSLRSVGAGNDCSSCDIVDGEIGDNYIAAPHLRSARRIGSYDSISHCGCFVGEVEDVVDHVVICWSCAPVSAVVGHSATRGMGPLIN